MTTEEKDSLEKIMTDLKESQRLFEQGVSRDRKRSMIWRLILAPIGLAVLFATPFLVVWSVNTIFETELKTKFDTWFAIMILWALFGRPSNYRSK